MGMGVGGGGLFIIFLTQYLNFSQITAQGTNLIFFALSGIFALLLHFKKRKINVFQVIVMTIFGILGTVIFSHLANMIDPDIPRKVLGGLLVISGVISIISLIKVKK